MKDVRNTGRIAVAFIIQKGNKEVKVSLDRQRHYSDTGNIATAGLTPVDEETLTELKKQAFFNQKVESGEFEILEESEVRTPEANKVASLEAENKKLQEELKKAKKADVKKVEEEKKALEDENASLKAQLEALTAKKEDKKEEADTEGF